MLQDEQEVNDVQTLHPVGHAVHNALSTLVELKYANLQVKQRV